MPSTTTQYATVLPHEPLPRPPAAAASCGSVGEDTSGNHGNGNGNGNNFYGYVHLQGAFVPKRKEGKDATTGNSSNSNAESSRDDNSCNNNSTISHIENTLRGTFQQLFAHWCMDINDLLSIRAVLQDATASSTEHNNVTNNKNDNATTTNNNNNNATISKVRLTLSSPATARRLTARLRRGAYSPRDLLSSAFDSAAGALALVNEGLCPNGSGGRYAGRPLQVTQVTPIAVADESVVVATAASSATDNKSETAAESNDDDDAARWARAAPPKFRRLQLNTNTISNKNKLTEEELEHRRGQTRFVYVENVLSGLTSEDVSFDGCGGMLNEDGESLEKLLKENLISIIRGRGIASTKNASREKLGQLHRGMMEDDVRHAFQEGLGEALSRIDAIGSVDDESSSTTNNGNNNASSRGAELFMKADTTPGKKSKSSANATSSNGATNGSSSSSCGIKMLYDHLHVGMRSNADATTLIRSWQGKRVAIEMELPSSLFTDRMSVSGGAASSAHSVMPKMQTVTVVTGKLFLDYADVLLPKGRQKRNGTAAAETATRGLPSRSECTSATSRVKIPGLRLLPDYVSLREEQILMAALAGPHAPWAPKQHTPSGGVIRRRVQHYGYVFDYESADVLRRDEEDDKGRERSACPPLPSIETSDVSGMTGEDVERWIDGAVEDVRGWEALAGVIERTRRVDFGASFAPQQNLDADGCDNIFDEKLNNLSLKTCGGGSISKECIEKEESPCLSSQQSSSHSSKQTYPHINQLTINEYSPGQGIGSHVDTESAFDDGLLVINLNGGIVMEFRKVSIDKEDVSNDKRKLLYLPPRSLLLLSGDARYKWEHMIVSRTTDTVDGKVLPRKLRLSLTLRTALTLATKGQIATPLPGYESAVFPPRWGQPSDADAKVDKHRARPTEPTSDLVTPSTESKHVHAVYDAIATQWHHTRGKRGVLWPGATAFLENLPKGSIVADVGCGDGKYFSAIWGCDSYVIGTDISEPLLKTAASTTSSSAVDDVDVTSDGPQYERLATEKQALSTHPAVAVADCIHLPLRSDSADAAICIAVMHHLSTEGRRLRCLSELRRVVKAGGMINVQAWALEQESDSKRKFHGTDVLVPFNAQPKYLETSSSLSQKREIEGNAQLGEASKGKKKGVAQMMAEQYNGAEFDDKKNLVVFQRYCHMYRMGELEGLVEQVSGLEVVESTYEKGNHVVLLRVS